MPGGRRTGARPIGPECSMRCGSVPATAVPIGTHSGSGCRSGRHSPVEGRALQADLCGPAGIKRKAGGHSERAGRRRTQCEGGLQERAGCGREWATQLARMSIRCGTACPTTVPVCTPTSHKDPQPCPVDQQCSGRRRLSPSVERSCATAALPHLHSPRMPPCLPCPVPGRPPPRCPCTPHPTPHVPRPMSHTPHPTSHVPLLPYALTVRELHGGVLGVSLAPHHHVVLQPGNLRHLRGNTRNVCRMHSDGPHRESWDCKPGTDVTLPCRRVVRAVAHGTGMVARC